MEMRQHHFITGLPRSGSTLLSAILRQNPRFHAGMTSPIGALFEGLLAQVSAGTELAPMVSVEQRKRLSRGLFDSYYADLSPDIETVFDTNRGWASRVSAVVELFPDARFICCVRNVAWVMDSLERQYRNNAFENTRLFNSPTERDTVYSRVETLAQRNRLVGFPWSALKEAVYGEHAERLLIVEYELLAARPREVFGLIYRFLGLDHHDHDFDHIEYDAPDFDSQLGLRGLHKVRSKVETLERRTVLPPDLFEQYAKLSFWRSLENSAANVIAVQPGNEA